MPIYAIIPARGGSKSVPKKNIKLLGGFPLLAYSIAAAKLSSKIDRVIVSTDSPEIAEIARNYEAEVPFLRPAELAQDLSTDFDVLYHAASWLKKEKGLPLDLLIYLRPTTPLRDPVFIDQAIDRLGSVPKATSLRSLHELPEPPQKMVKLTKTGLIEGFFPNDRRAEYYNLPRQNFPKAYQPNGIIDIVRYNILKTKTGRIFGPRILGLVTPWATEIDIPRDWEYLEYIFKKEPGPLFNYLKANFKKRS